MVQVLMSEDNAIQNERVQLRFAVETPDEGAGSGIEVEIRFAQREPDTPEDRSCFITTNRAPAVPTNLMKALLDGSGVLRWLKILFT